MTDDEIIAFLSTLHGFKEVYSLRQFLCYREAKSGHMQEVAVQIWDAGPFMDKGMRYHCYAKTDDGKSATGNPADTIHTAMSLVHWGNLDR